MFVVPVNYINIDSYTADDLCFQRESKIFNRKFTGFPTDLLRDSENIIINCFIQEILSGKSEVTNKGSLYYGRRRHRWETFLWETSVSLFSFPPRFSVGGGKWVVSGASV